MSGEIYAVTPEGEEIECKVDGDGSVWIKVLDKFDKKPKQVKIELRRNNGRRSK